ncbi:DSBA-like thioredoxin domain protein [Halomonas sp. THAF12]|uniref:DsbA family oxidoreductase n=1 Tax=Halomonas sp. THAF12 TaxID=2587849 RepID=UPI001267940B|nr:DsbA family protein [Halomonas sp. THAF12]QFT85434.1 DSBA-like thioredoxin domain protein [Halomonas sp. THAF12]
MTLSPTPSLTLDFFHDVVCGWCFNLSPRLHRLAEEFELNIRHRTFVLQDSPARMVEVFGSMGQAKATILDHWAACREASEAPERFNIEGMRRAPFDYPHGLPGALACQAAQYLAGQAGHWQMFDAIQVAHLSEARNVADPRVLRSIAREAGFGTHAFTRLMEDPATLEAVQADQRLARQLRVSVVPTVIVRETGQRLVNGSLESLRAQLLDNLRLVSSGLTS